jgi:hypothetical protein
MAALGTNPAWDTNILTILFQTLYFVHTEVRIGSSDKYPQLNMPQQWKDYKGKLQQIVW